jgi:large subunit ribosomal protein L21
MYAIVADGGRQYRVEEGQEFDIDLRDVSAGDELTFDRVLACRTDSEFHLGRPTVEGASVIADVIAGAVLGKKIVVGKLRRRKTFRRRMGHRQLYTRVRIRTIRVG